MVLEVRASAATRASAIERGGRPLPGVLAWVRTGQGTRAQAGAAAAPSYNISAFRDLAAAAFGRPGRRPAPAARAGAARSGVFSGACAALLFLENGSVIHTPRRPCGNGTPGLGSGGSGGRRRSVRAFEPTLRTSIPRAAGGAGGWWGPRVAVAGRRAGGPSVRPVLANLTHVAVVAPVRRSRSAARPAVFVIADHKRLAGPLSRRSDQLHHGGPGACRRGRLRRPTASPKRRRRLSERFPGARARLPGAPKGRPASDVAGDPPQRRRIPRPPFRRGRSRSCPRPGASTGASFGSAHRPPQGRTSDGRLVLDRPPALKLVSAARALDRRGPTLRQQHAERRTR